MKKIIYIIILILTVLICQNAWAGGGGGGKSPAPQPQYYTFEDLKEGIRKESFTFANLYKPANALVNLGYYSFYPASYGKFYRVHRMIRGNPVKYRTNLYRPASLWVDNPEIYFNWGNFNTSEGTRGNKGDLIFLRGTGKGANFVKMFSQWTHVAIVTVPDQKTVFESMIDGGVKERYAPASWERITYYTCKKIEPLSYEKIWERLDSGKRNFENKPYFPQYFSTNHPSQSFLQRWSDKNNTESMYCSKLIYQIFKDDLNLDSDNTQVFFNLELINGFGATNPLSWIGVSPDDIYYSEALGQDFSNSANCASL